MASFWAWPPRGRAGIGGAEGVTRGPYHGGPGACACVCGERPARRGAARGGAAGNGEAGAGEGAAERLLPEATDGPAAARAGGRGASLLGPQVSRARAGKSAGGGAPGAAGAGAGARGPVPDSVEPPAAAASEAGRIRRRPGRRASASRTPGARILPSFLGSFLPPGSRRAQLRPRARASGRRWRFHFRVGGPAPAAAAGGARGVAGLRPGVLPRPPRGRSR